MLIDGPALRAIARGAAVLGAGGGGDTGVGLLVALQAIEDTDPSELVDLDDLPDDGLWRGHWAIADERFADAVDRAKTVRGDQPVVVGGGSVLVPDRLPAPA